MKDKGFLAAFVHAHAHEVAGHQVGGELHARELQAQRDGQRVRQRGLAHTRNVLDQQVPGSEQAGHAVFDLRAFAHDDRANLIDQP